LCVVNCLLLFLTQNLLNNHDVLEPGHVTIEMAVERMVNAGRLINEMKRRHEKAVHVQEIQSRLYGWDGADLTTLGDLVLDVRIKRCPHCCSSGELLAKLLRNLL
jgi:hypothetical protein